MTEDLKNGLKYIHNHKTFVPKIRAIQVNLDVNTFYDMYMSFRVEGIKGQ